MKTGFAIVATSLLIYYILQSIEDSKHDRAHEPRATIGKKMALLFFVGMVVLIFFHLMGVDLDNDGLSGGAGAVGGVEALANGSGSAIGGGILNINRGRNDIQSYSPTEMIKNIKQEVQVGSVPF